MLREVVEKEQISGEMQNRVNLHFLKDVEEAACDFQVAAGFPAPSLR